MIRALRSGEAAAVAALIREAFAAIMTPLDPPPSALGMTAEAVLAQEGGAVWDESGLQGCVLWREAEGGLHIGRMSVRPGLWGRGIGWALLLGAAAEAEQRGLDRLWLEVRLAMVGNRRLFAAFGFVEVAMCAHPGHSSPTFARAEKRVDTGFSGH